MKTSTTACTPASPPSFSLCVCFLLWWIHQFQIGHQILIVLCLFAIEFELVVVVGWFWNVGCHGWIFIGFVFVSNFIYLLHLLSEISLLGMYQTDQMCVLSSVQFIKIDDGDTQAYKLNCSFSFEFVSFHFISIRFVFSSIDTYVSDIFIMLHNLCMNGKHYFNFLGEVTKYLCMG